MVIYISSCVLWNCGDYSGEGLCDEGGDVDCEGQMQFVEVSVVLHIKFLKLSSTFGVFLN
jgi:hypothetical protein